MAPSSHRVPRGFADMVAAKHKGLSLLVLTGAVTALLLCLPSAAFAQGHDWSDDQPEGSISGVVALTDQDADKRQVIDTVYVNTASIYFHSGDSVEFTGTVPAGAKYTISPLTPGGTDGGFEEWEGGDGSQAYSDGWKMFPTFKSNTSYRYSVGVFVTDATKYRFSENTKLILNGRTIDFENISYASVIFQESSPDRIYFSEVAALYNNGIWQRLWGDTALDTMMRIVAEGWEPGETDTVVIATMSGFYDALAAAPLAGSFNAPVLLTKKTELSPETEAMIDYLEADHAIIVGGPAAVSENVENALVSKLGYKNVDRVWGDNAQETAVKIGQEARAHMTPSGVGIVATSASYQDALAIAPYAYSRVAPIYLTNRKGELSADTLAAIQAGGHFKIVIVGGPVAVPDATEQQIKDMGFEVERLGGESALETSNKIAEFCVDGYPEMAENAVGVATVGGYHDALAGAALCGKLDVPLVLMPKKGTNFYTADHYINDHLDSIERGYIFGGHAAVSDAAWFYLNDQYEDYISL